MASAARKFEMKAVPLGYLKDLAAGDESSVDIVLEVASEAELLRHRAALWSSAGPTAEQSSV